MIAPSRIVFERSGTMRSRSVDDAAEALAERHAPSAVVSKQPGARDNGSATTATPAVEKVCTRVEEDSAPPAPSQTPLRSSRAVSRTDQPHGQAHRRSRPPLSRGWISLIPGSESGRRLVPVSCPLARRRALSIRPARTSSGNDLISGPFEVRRWLQRRLPTSGAASPSFRQITSRPRRGSAR